jgi:hypothetical protein
VLAFRERDRVLARRAPRWKARERPRAPWRRPLCSPPDLLESDRPSQEAGRIEILRLVDGLIAQDSALTILVWFGGSRAASEVRRNATGHRFRQHAADQLRAQVGRD